MKFILSSGPLLQALNMTSRCISNRAIIPILDSFLFQIAGNLLIVTASNNEVFMSTSVEIENKGGDLSIAIPSSQLMGLIKSFPDQPLVFEIQPKQVDKVKAYNVKIKSPSGNFTLPGEDGNSYPTLKINPDISFKIIADVLVRGIDKTLFASSNDGLRPQLCGVNVGFEDGKVIFTATNTNMLSTFSYTANIECSRTFIIPQKVLSLLLSAPKSDEIQVAIDDRTISFVLNEETTLQSLLIDERYVDYQAVIPRNSPNHLIIDRVAFTSALKRVIQLSDKVTKAVKISLSPSLCEISSEDTDLGQDAYETVECEYDDQPISIGLMGVQLIDCMGKFDTQEVHLYFSTPNRAVIIRDHYLQDGDKHNLMITMPVMLANR